jgi:hypothetical protein
MSEVLNVETLRNKILRLIAEAISDSNSDLAKTLNTKINALAKAAIDSDNENDINWDETDELFGDYNGNNSNPTPTPTSTPSSTPSSTPQMYTTMPPLTVKAHNGGSFNPGHVILTIEGNGGTVTDKIEVKRLPYNGSLTFDAPQIVISSPRYTWSIKYGNGSSATYHAGMECIMGSGYLYNAIITVNTESSPETT